MIGFQVWLLLLLIVMVVHGMEIKVRCWYWIARHLSIGIVVIMLPMWVVRWLVELVISIFLGGIHCRHLW